MDIFQEENIDCNFLVRAYQHRFLEPPISFDTCVLVLQNMFGDRCSAPPQCLYEGYLMIRNTRGFAAAGE